MNTHQAASVTTFNAETSLIKAEESENQSLQPNQTSMDAQQNEMDISTTTSTITNVSSIENTIDSNDNSENEETNREPILKEDNIENQQPENASNQINVDVECDINTRDSAIDISENAVSANHMIVENPESIDLVENQKSIETEKPNE